jgi:hypothetical protein
MTKEAIAKSPVARPKRTPIGQRNVLTVDKKDPNYVYRFVNDANERVEAFKLNGWEPVPAGEAKVGDSRVEQASPEGSVTSVSVGGGTKAVLMRIPREWFDEDQKAKHDEIDRLEQTMKEDAQREYGGLKGSKLEITRG